MDIILLLLGAWYLSGLFGRRNRRPKPRRRRSSWWNDPSFADYEEHCRRSPKGDWR